MKRYLCIILCAFLFAGCSFKKGTNNINEEYAYDAMVLTQDVESPYDDEGLVELMEGLMKTYGLNEQNFSISYENLVTHQTYTFNDTSLMVGASTVKVPINMMYIDYAYAIEETYLEYGVQDYEEGGGFTAVNYMVGDLIPLSYLMDQSIVYSDNTAINIMLNSIGFDAFREYYANYTDEVYDDSFYYQNLTSASLLHEVTTRLYEQSYQYNDILNNMLEAMPNRYMKKLLDGVEIAHKYGEYDTYEHDFGIVYAS